jgi:hypothetical protein
MFFARTAHDEHRSDDDPAEQKSHNALAQLSAPDVRRKVKAWELSRRFLNAKAPVVASALQRD